MKNKTIVAYTATAEGGKLVLNSAKEIVIHNPSQAVLALVGDRTITIDEKGFNDLQGSTQEKRKYTRRAKQAKGGVVAGEGSTLAKQLGRKNDRRLGKILAEYGVAAVNRFNTGELGVTSEALIASKTVPVTLARITGAANMAPSETRAYILSKLPKVPLSSILTAAQTNALSTLAPRKQGLIVATQTGVEVVVLEKDSVAYPRRGDVTTFGRKN